MIIESRKNIINIHYHFRASQTIAGGGVGDSCPRPPSARLNYKTLFEPTSVKHNYNK